MITTFYDDNSNITNKIRQFENRIGKFEYRLLNDNSTGNPVTVIKNSYINMDTATYYYGCIITNIYSYFYIGFKMLVNYSTFLIFGYHKYLHIARLFDNTWTDETIL